MMTGYAGWDRNSMYSMLSMTLYCSVIFSSCSCKICGWSVSSSI